MKLLKLIASAVISIALIMSFCSIAFAAETIIIDKVTIKEYEDEFGATDDELLTFVVDFTITNASDQITVLLTSENISLLSSETASKVIYIDQAVTPSETTYTFTVEKSRIQSATGLDNIDGCTLYLKMGASGVSEAASTTVEYSEPTADVMYGDVTDDGIIDIADAIKILRYDAGYDELTSEQLLAAELTNDGIVDIADAIKILRYDAGYDSTIK